MALALSVLFLLFISCATLSVAAQTRTHPQIPSTLSRSSHPAAGAPSFTLSHAYEDAPITGRAYLIVSSDFSQEPRLLISDAQDTQQIFGMDIDQLPANTPVRLDPSALGYPLSSLAEVPMATTYAVQAVIQPYERVQRSVGPPVWLPRTLVNRFPNLASGLLQAPGTLYSPVVNITLAVDSSIALVAAHVQPDVAPFVGPANDTSYVKHLSVYNARLSQFWGRDIFLEACVLLPWGWDEHADAKYPMVVYQGHYSDDWLVGMGFAEQPPPDAHLDNLDYVHALYGYYLYRNWTGPEGLFYGRRVIVVTIKHPNPFFDDSYAVNSDNIGPYGDAIHLDLIPTLEQRFRAIGEPWARVTFGGSTGGWEAMAAQVLYPKWYNGAWVSCPDPVDFRAYTTINLYNDTNAYFYDAPWKRTARPGLRDTATNQQFPIAFGVPLGQTTATIQELNMHELVLGENTRSTGQFDIWEAVFAPMNKTTGYPQRLWDKRTGEMHADVIAQARENYDLTHILQRDWATLGPLLVGKLSIYVGGSDSWFLNNAVMLLQDFLESTTTPYYNGTVVIGNHDGRGFAHCWTGDATSPNAISRLTQLQRFVPLMVDRMLSTAPQGADVASWRY